MVTFGNWKLAKPVENMEITVKQRLRALAVPVAVL